MFMFLLVINHMVLTSHITVSLFVGFFKNAATVNGEGLLYHTENGFFPCKSVIQDLGFSWWLPWLWWWWWCWR